MTKIPRFQGKPLVELPEGTPMANFLEGKFGEWVNKEVQGKYGKFSVINKISHKGGSNPFYCVAVNEKLEENNLNLRTTTQEDLEKILQTNALNLRGTYEDSALVLRSIDNPNKYLAQNLANQIQNPKYPLMINLKDFELVEDQDSEYGLAFKIKENAEIITSKILDGKNNGKKFSKTKKYGLPVFNKNGDRTFYAGDSGLFRLVLDYYLDLGSGWDDLGDSGSDGRVIIVSGEIS